MNTYIALFRGINVGGKHSLPMKELVALIEGLGGQNVRTYIQSGNAVFESKAQSITRLVDSLRAGIKQQRGFDPHVLILTRGDLERAIAKNPFPDATSEPATLHAGFLVSAPKKPDLAKLESLKSKTERFYLGHQIFYLHAPDGIGRSKLAASAEKLLGVAMTDRNWRTVCQIWKMANE